MVRRLSAERFNTMTNAEASARRAGKSLLEEGRHPEEGRAQGPQSAKGKAPAAAPKKEANAGKKTRLRAQSCG